MWLLTDTFLWTKERETGDMRPYKQGTTSVYQTMQAIVSSFFHQLSHKETDSLRKKQVCPKNIELPVLKENWGIKRFWASVTVQIHLIMTFDFPSSPSKRPSKRNKNSLKHSSRIVLRILSAQDRQIKKYPYYFQVLANIRIKYVTRQGNCLFFLLHRSSSFRWSWSWLTVCVRKTSKYAAK